MNPHFQRAQVLFQQGRYDMAAQALRRGLGDDPDSPYAHALLGLSLGRQGQFPEAAQEAHTAIGLAPDYAFAHYAAAAVWEKQDRLADAERAVREAVRLDPEEADYLALLSSIQMQGRRWADALATAEAGLSLEADHAGCVNLRAMALRQLGRRQEAGATIAAALARDPENAVTHANQGWTLLHQGRHAQAMEHFREALRLEPNNAWARDGILEALRARNPVYRVMLAYFLWMSRLSRQAQWGILVGGYVGFRLLETASGQQAAWRPVLVPLIVAYLVFVYLSWTARPLFNLLLQLDPFGRLALSRDQKAGANWFGGCLLGALLCGVGFLLSGVIVLLAAALALFLLTIPVAATFAARRGTPRKGLGAYAIGLAAVAALGLVLIRTSVFLPLCTLFGVGIAATTWVASALRR